MLRGKIAGAVRQNAAVEKNYNFLQNTKLFLVSGYNGTC